MTAATVIRHVVLSMRCHNGFISLLHPVGVFQPPSKALIYYPWIYQTHPDYFSDSSGLSAAQ